MTKTTHHEPKTKHLSPLAADIEAEFGSLRDVRGEGARLAKARADALRIAFEQAARTLPEALRQGFIRNCAKRLEVHFGRDYREIRESQFHEAVAVVGQQIGEARQRIDKLAIELQPEDNRRWRVTFFDLTN